MLSGIKRSGLGERDSENLIEVSCSSWKAAGSFGTGGIGETGSIEGFFPRVGEVLAVDVETALLLVPEAVREEVDVRDVDETVR